MVTVLILGSLLNDVLVVLVQFQFNDMHNIIMVSFCNKIMSKHSMLLTLGTHGQEGELLHFFNVSTIDLGGKSHLTRAPEQL